MPMSKWPIIRHIRYLYHRHQVARHYAMWQSLGSLPVYAAHDMEALDEIWRGER